MNIIIKSLFLFSVLSVASWGTMENEFKTSSVIYHSQPTLKKNEQEVPKDLYLVVGSTRKESYINPFARKIFGENVDLTHQNTFQGKAITLDLEPSIILEAPHIQADARFYKPKAEAVIRAVFMELFPSISLSSTGVENKEKDTKTKWSKMMLMPETIRNLAQYMPEGATLEIEHIPFISFTEMKNYAQNILILRETNPFHCFLSPFFMENLGARNYLGVNNKVSFWKSVLGAKKYIFPWDDESAGSIVDEAVKSHPTLLRAIENIMAFLPNEANLQGRLNVEFNLYKTNPANFISKVFHGSLSELVAIEFTMLSQQNLIKSFLERNGFKEAKIERKNNPYNRRKNVWMISAVRNNQSIPQEDE